MGIDYKSLVAIGKVFGSADLAVDFILHNAVQPLGDLNIDAIEDSLEEWLEDQEWEPDLEGGVLDYFSGEGFWIGYSINKQNFHDTEKLVEKFENTFDTVPEFVKEVIVF